MNLGSCFAKALKPLLLGALATGACFAAAQPLVEVAGSPFHLADSRNSNNGALSPDGHHLYVTGPGNGIMAFSVLPGGGLSPIGVFPTPAVAGGMTFNPAGTRLYVECASFTTAYDIDEGGALTLRQTVSGGLAGVAISYVSLAGGDFVYVENAHSIIRYQVNADGSLFNAFGFGSSTNSVNYYAAHRMAYCSSTACLYVGSNQTDSIASYHVDPLNGFLTAPTFVACPNFSSLAVDSSPATLYAACEDGNLKSFHLGIDGSMVPASTGSVSGTIDDIAIDPSHSMLICTAPDANRIYCLDPSNLTNLAGSPLSRGGVTFSPAGLTLNSSGSQLYCTCAASGTTVEVFDVAGGAVTHPTLTDFTLAPSPVEGAHTITGTITLSGPADGSGVTVSLSSNALESYSIPLATPPVAGPLRIFGMPSPRPSIHRVWRVRNTNSTPVTFTYRLYFGPSHTRTFTAPPNCDFYFGTDALSGSQNTIQLLVGGVLVQTQAQVSTVGPVPVGLWCFLHMPATVTVPPGASSATFTFTPDAVEADVSCTCTAELDGVAKSASLSVMGTPGGNH